MSRVFSSNRLEVCGAGLENETLFTEDTLHKCEALRSFKRVDFRETDIIDMSLYDYLFSFIMSQEPVNGYSAFLEICSYPATKALIGLWELRKPG